jgi:hypothetical protein
MGTAKINISASNKENIKIAFSYLIEFEKYSFALY